MKRIWDVSLDTRYYSFLFLFAAPAYLLILFPYSSNSQTADTQEALDYRLSGPLVADETELSTILILLQDESGLNFVLDQGCNPKVIFKLDNPSVREILDAVLPSVGLDYVVFETGAVRIGPKAVINKIKMLKPQAGMRYFMMGVAVGITAAFIVGLVAWKFRLGRART